MGEKFKFERKERIRKDVYDMVSMCLSESISGNGVKVVFLFFLVLICWICFVRYIIGYNKSWFWLVCKYIVWWENLKEWSDLCFVNDDYKGDVNLFFWIGKFVRVFGNRG